jgi:wyosine [tRNA(Phe)-imidazoG37] synthetase (radical SAM superfamily)
MNMLTERRSFYPPERIIGEVRERIASAREQKDPIDFLSFVPDGEPTLDENLGEEITKLGESGIRTAVISNASLLWREDVREELSMADWVSVKVDAVREGTWRRINCPHRDLNLDSILEGILRFSEIYKGVLTTETMLVRDRNDAEEELREIADFLSLVHPKISYLSIPTRPPADKRVRPPGEQAINHAFQIFREKLDTMEYLIGYEGNAFSSTGNFEKDILGITAVHPMQEDAVRDLLERTDSSWEAVKSLIAEGKLTETVYGGRRFYIRRK